MNIMQPYYGKFVSADSARKYLDIETILKGCDEVDAEAEEICRINSKLNNAGNLITPKALSIDNVTVDNSLMECFEGINGVYQNILSETSQVRSAAVNIYNNIQNDLNNDAAARDRNAINNSKRQG